MKTIPSHQRPQVVRRALANLALAALAALMFLGGARFAHAQSGEVDPPGRVARLSEVSGQVWLYNADANEWTAVARNRPLTSGDRIATDNNARAEIALGSSTLRLDSGTELEIARLDDARFIVRLVNGSVVARLRNQQALSEFELDTDEGRFRAQAAGRFRFDRNDQASDLTVLSGQATFEGRNSALPLTTGQHGQFWLDANGAAQYTMLAPVRDAFAVWNDDRDRAEDRVAAVRYVSPEMTGAQDLDRYGRWEQTPEYGALWQPAAVPVGWAPYSTGHWAWVRPWGWTWVDDAPWGFAPFHYGRWVYHRDAWCWAPGTYVARPVYAPALVAWMGGPRVSVSINIGGGGPPVGWFPLAPREVYVPSYRSSPTYVRNVNVTHVTNITNITTIVNNRNGEADRRDFANRRFPNAVTVVPASVLTGRQQVAPAAAQYRDNPQVRALIADARPAAVAIAAPVAAPAPPPARAGDARPAMRPPFEGRGPGNVAGPAAGNGNANGNSNGNGNRTPSDAGAIGRPPRGAIGREPPATDSAAAQVVVPPSPVQRPPKGGEAFGRPGFAPRAESLQRAEQAQRAEPPRAEQAPRTEPPQRAEPLRPAPRVEPAMRADQPPARVVPEPPRNVEPVRPQPVVRGMDAQRFGTPPAMQQQRQEARPEQAPMQRAEPRFDARPELRRDGRQEQRANEPPRVAEPPRAAAPAPRPPEARPEPAARPAEAARPDKGRDDRRDDRQGK